MRKSIALLISMNFQYNIKNVRNYQLFSSLPKKNIFNFLLHEYIMKWNLHIRKWFINTFSQYVELRFSKKRERQLLIFLHSLRWWPHLFCIGRICAKETAIFTPPAVNPSKSIHPWPPKNKNRLKLQRRRCPIGRPIDLD